MGYKDSAKYYKDLHQQAYDRLNKMQAFGQSKKEDIPFGRDKEKIYSYSTYKTYWKHIKYFIKYVNENHSDCRNLKQARQYTNEWLEKRSNENLSAWTIQTEAKALGKLFGISPDDPDYFEPPIRRRQDIKRSRGPAERDKHFSEKNNAELIRFCKGVGARRAGLEKLKGKDLFSKDEINKKADFYEKLALTRELTEKEKGTLQICKDAQLFEKNEYFVFLREKGGKERLSPIIGPDTNEIVNRFKNTAPEEKVWRYVNKNADIHGYRADYSNRVYDAYARDIADIPFDKKNRGTGRMYQSEVYVCRKDEAGKKLDKAAMLLASKALGHNRIEVVANNYLRGL